MLFIKLTFIHLFINTIKLRKFSNYSKKVTFFQFYMDTRQTQTYLKYIHQLIIIQN